MADFLLVLGETPPSDPAYRTVNKKINIESQKKPSVLQISIPGCYLLHLTPLPHDYDKFFISKERVT